MKIFELKEQQPLQIEEVTVHHKIPKIDNFNYPEEIEMKQSRMVVYTDGIIENESEPEIKSINEYYIGKKKYEYDVDTLKKKNLFFKNHSYIIVFTITNEYRELANFRGWFDIVSNVQIYLANTKDKRALKEAKKVIKILNNSNNTTYTSALMSTFLKPHNDEIEQINSQKITDNVYTLSLTR